MQAGCLCVHVAIKEVTNLFTLHTMNALCCPWYLWQRVGKVPVGCWCTGSYNWVEILLSCLDPANFCSKFDACLGASYASERMVGMVIPFGLMWGLLFITSSWVRLMKVPVISTIPTNRKFILKCQSQTSLHALSSTNPNVMPTAC